MIVASALSSSSTIAGVTASLPSPNIDLPITLALKRHAGSLSIKAGSATLTTKPEAHALVLKPGSATGTFKTRPISLAIKPATEQHAVKHEPLTLSIDG